MIKKQELERNLQTNFNFDLSVDQKGLDSESAYLEYIQKQLAMRVKFFIQTDMDKLLQALYRIDVNDRETDQAFSLGEINAVSEKIAQLILKRQLQKLDYSKEFYKNEEK
ncbi:MAG: hypothetical protein KC478_17215 [Bacteriovoracaceae bacterium]|nr:hypothetical protein [Bacteriovoracaceae bacterium]